MKMTSYIHTFILYSIIIFGLGVFFYAAPDTSVQFFVGVVTSVAYVLWGIVHHAIQKDLHMKVVIEYMLMGAIAISLFAVMLKS